MFVLVGRWSPARLSGGFEELPFYAEVRFWVAGAIALVAWGWAASLPVRRLGLPRSIHVTMTLLFSWVLASAAWAADSVTAMDKAYEVALLWVVVVSLQVALHRASATAMMLVCWTASILLLLVLAVLGVVSVVASARLAVLGGGPIVYGRNMALFGLGALFFCYGRGGSLAWLALAAFSLPLVVLSGSRGAMLAAFTAGTVAVWLYNRGLTRKVQFLIVATGLTAILLRSELARLSLRMFQTRVIELTFEQTYMSGRAGLYEAAWKVGVDHPVAGVGLGGFGTEVIGWTYPHNLFLEVFSECGGVGLGLLVLLLASCALVLVRQRRSLDAASLGAVILFFVAVQTSGSFYDSRGLWVWALVTVAAAREVRAAEDSESRAWTSGS